MSLSPTESEHVSAPESQDGSSPGDLRLPPLGSQRPVRGGTAHDWPAPNTRQSPSALSQRPATSPRGSAATSPAGCGSLCACVRLPRLLSAFSRRRRRRRRSSVHPSAQPADLRPVPAAPNGFVARELSEPPPPVQPSVPAGERRWDGASADTVSYRAVPGPPPQGRLRLGWLPAEEQLSTALQPSPVMGTALHRTRTQCNQSQHADGAGCWPVCDFVRIKPS